MVAAIGCLLPVKKSLRWSCQVRISVDIVKWTAAMRDITAASAVNKAMLVLTAMFIGMTESCLSSLYCAQSKIVV